MDVDLVNVGQYKAAVKMGVCPRPPQTSDISDSWKLGNNRRAQNNVNYFAAQAFLGWIGKRLPTEEEWEWAARGREKGYIYPWGNDPPEQDSACWLRYFPEKDVCLGPDLVGVDRATSRDGVHDMAGCLWEWTSTVDPENSGLMILKGGAWYNDNPEKLKVTGRGRAIPYHNEVNVTDSEGLFRSQIMRSSKS
ncbi:MAG: formylglycine-generating enzyme family protein [Pirellulales bacterium]|nr:formylglycine-generating enzyme family protein [Pirellulales bacterium]